MDIEQHILDSVEMWAGGKSAVKEWYETQYNSAIDSTAQILVDNGHQQAVIDYLDGITTQWLWVMEYRVTRGRDLDSTIKLSQYAQETFWQ